jgi:hypothetical protein
MRYLRTLLLVTLTMLSLFFVGATPAQALSCDTTPTTWSAFKNAMALNGTQTVCLTVLTDLTSNTVSGDHVSLVSGANITLDLNGHNLTISAETGYAGVNVPPTATLTIKATGGGTLSVEGGPVAPSGAGIGGNARQISGAVVINGGTITAIGKSGAGIGGGYGAKGGNVTINGGTVTASATTNNMAGIGGGNPYEGGITVITGGTVVATGGGNGPGLTASFDTSITGLTISGGTISARGGADTGAGGGTGMIVSNILISGGSTTATGGLIGSSGNGSTGTVVFRSLALTGGSLITTATQSNGLSLWGSNSPSYITGGSLTATGALDGAGILVEENKALHITGGSVHATAGNGGGAAVGMAYARGNAGTLYVPATTGGSITATTGIGYGANYGRAAALSTTLPATSGVTYDMTGSEDATASRPATMMMVFSNNSAPPGGGTGSGTVPGVPSGVSATAGNGQATVVFIPPASDGGSAINGYMVTATDTTTPGNGGQTVAGAGSPIVVTGLTNGDSYTFTVTATNTVGTGAASTASSPATPATTVVTAVPTPADPSLAATGSDQALPMGLAGLLLITGLAVLGAARLRSRSGDQLLVVLS